MSQHGGVCAFLFNGSSMFKLICVPVKKELAFAVFVENMCAKNTPTNVLCSSTGDVALSSSDQRPLADRLVE